MKLLADLHTHSNNSRFFHGKNSIEEMVREANAIGLKEIAITDHGFKHFFRTSKQKIIAARKLIDEINEWSSTKVLLGIEANIIAEDGTIDVDNDILSILDILIVGYHKMIKTDFAGFFGGQEKTKDAIQKCTNAYLNAIEKYPITIISHLDSVLTTDLYQIGLACKEKGVMVEINNRHTNWNDDQVNDLLAADCMFVVSSDAHSRSDVGRVDKAFNIIKKYDIPSENIANVEFEESEKSEMDRAVTPYMSIYSARKKKREEQLQKLENKKRKEFTNTLSDEMEDALKNIAREQGIKYTPLEEDEINAEDDLLNFDNFIDEYGNFVALETLKKFEEESEEIEGAEDLIQEDESQMPENVEEESFDVEENTEEPQEEQISQHVLEGSEHEWQNRPVEQRENKEESQVSRPRGFGLGDMINDIKQDKK